MKIKQKKTRFFLSSSEVRSDWMRTHRAAAVHAIVVDNNKRRGVTLLQTVCPSHYGRHSEQRTNLRLCGILRNDKVEFAWFGDFCYSFWAHANRVAHKQYDSHLASCVHTVEHLASYKFAHGLFVIARAHRVAAT